MVFTPVLAGPQGVDPRLCGLQRVLLIVDHFVIHYDMKSAVDS
jgi:hypothetical protein